MISYKSEFKIGSSFKFHVFYSMKLFCFENFYCKFYLKIIPKIGESFIVGLPEGAS
jgi:hypothetical protein